VTDSEQSSTGAGEVSFSPAPLVELVGITKRFGAVVACDDVDLALHPGQIHGVLGENGAGKSTLMKVLIGLVLPDSGSILISGTKCTIHDPIDAARHGIGMVHQHFSLIEPLTVWENVALGDSGKLDPDEVRNRISELGEQYGLIIDPDARVQDLTAGLRQRVEIIKCLRRDPSVLIFDEPTSVLTPEESQQLFKSLRSMVTSEGKSVVLVSHKLDEVLSTTDDITIMRRGCVVDRMDTTDTDAPALARSMVGREVSLRTERAAIGYIKLDKAADESPMPELTTEPILRIANANAAGPGGRRLLDDLTVDACPGEVVGVAGVEGNGQRPLADLLSSLLSLDSGTVTVDGEAVPAGAPGAMSRAGIGVIPEDRHDSGVVLDMTVAENLVLTNPLRVATNGIIDRRALDDLAEEMIREFGIQCSGPHAPMWTLSGGNQQRVVLARELADHPKVLVAAQPTRGLDVGAIEYMTGRIRDAAAAGVAVLLISSELEEILDIADRIVVMSGHRIVGEMPRAGIDLEHLGLLMGGSTV